MLRSPPPTPPRKITSNETFLTPLNQQTSALPDIKKRRRHNDENEEMQKTNNEIFEFMQTMHKSLINIDTKMDARMKKIETNVINIKEDIKTLDEKVEIGNKRLDANEKNMNWILQERLQTKMEIDGVNIPEITTREDSIQKTTEILKALKIEVDAKAIKMAYSREIKMRNGNSKKILIVEFQDVESKINVMKQKLFNKNRDGVYFNHCLTSNNRTLMMKTRKIAAEKKFKYFLQNNRILVKKSESIRKYVEDEDDLKLISEWTENEPEKMEETYASTSSQQNVNAV